MCNYSEQEGYASPKTCKIQPTSCFLCVSDRDECLEKFDGEPACNQICVNIVGSFQCACYRWYVKEPDQKTCRLGESACIFLFISNFNFLGI